MNDNENINFPPTGNLKPRRIGIDARFYGPLGKGLGRYTQEVVDNILKLDQTNDYVIFLYGENFHDFTATSPRIKKVMVDLRWYGLKEQLFFPFYIWREHLDLMHFPHFNVPVFCPTKFIVTIHDLILLKYPTRRASTLSPFAYALKNFFYKIVIWTAVKRARRVIAVSAYTKKDIAEKFRAQPDKISVTYEGVTNFFLNKNLPGENALAKYQIKKPYLLYVGNAYPHKNLEGSIKVFSGLSQELHDLNLVLVGKEDYFYKRLKDSSSEYGSRVIFPGYVPDRDLAVLYRQALAYVFPSFFEGFGLPALEAMAYDLPVVSSNKTCLPEILGEAAVYFNPKNEKEMKEKIQMVIKDENLRRSLSLKGREQVKKYSWPNCAQATLEIYRQILK